MEIVYCEGWSPDVGALVGRLTEATARRRDAGGAQYAVALVGDFGAPVALLEIAWTHRFARSWAFDEQGRRVREVEYRRLPDDRLFMLRVKTWEYPSPDTPEFDETETPWGEWENGPHGQSRTTTSTGRVLIENVPPEKFTIAAPAFGDWRFWEEFGAAATARTAPDPTASGPVPPPWRPPTPLVPFATAETFTPGTRFALPGGGGEVVVETHAAGTLRMPTGSLTVADPYDVAETTPFVVTVEPGEYPVDVSLARFVSEPEHVRPAAVRLTVRPGPVASWEMALVPGQDPLFLSEGRLYGFGVESGLACLVDADVGAVLAQEVVGRDGEFAEVTAPDTAGNMIVCHAGWGDGYYPTWLGRTTAGEPAAFVIDFRVLSGGAVLH